MWPRRQERVSRPDASPPRCAQLMGLASRGCLVLVLGATAERRNLFFRSDLGLPWIRTLGLPPIQVKQTVKCVGPSVQRASRRPSPIPVRAHVGPDRQHRRRYRPTSTSRSRRVWPPFKWTTILDTRVLIAEDLGAAPAPLVLAQVQCYTRRSAASRHPSRWRGAATSI